MKLKKILATFLATGFFLVFTIQHANAEIQPLTSAESEKMYAVTTNTFHNMTRKDIEDFAFETFGAPATRYFAEIARSYQEFFEAAPKGEEIPELDPNFKIFHTICKSLESAEVPKELKVTYLIETFAIAQETAEKIAALTEEDMNPERLGYSELDEEQQPLLPETIFARHNTCPAAARSFLEARLLDYLQKLSINLTPEESAQIRSVTNGTFGALSKTNVTAILFETLGEEAKTFYNAPVREDIPENKKIIKTLDNAFFAWESFPKAAKTQCLVKLFHIGQATAEKIAAIYSVEQLWQEKLGYDKDEYLERPCDMFIDHPACNYAALRFLEQKLADYLEHCDQVDRARQERQEHLARRRRLDPVAQLARMRFGLPPTDNGSFGRAIGRLIIHG